MNTTKAYGIYQADPNVLGEYLREIAPPLIFYLLPLFALLLKLLYVFKGIYYTRHLIFAVHIHCFVFLWLAIFSLIDWGLLSFSGTPNWLSFGLNAWCIFYLWRSLHVVYQQGRLLTSLKYLILAFCYFILAATTLVTAVIFGIMTV